MVQVTLLFTLGAIVLFAGPITRRASSILLTVMLPVLAGLSTAFNEIAMTAEAVARSGAGVHPTAAGSAEALVPLIAAAFAAGILAIVTSFGRNVAQPFATRAGAVLAVIATVATALLLVIVASLNWTAWLDPERLILASRTAMIVLAGGFLAALALIVRPQHPSNAERHSRLVPLACAVTAFVIAAGLWSLTIRLEAIARGAV